MPVLTALLMGVIFLIDLSLPLGVAGGVPYVAVVLLGWWSERTVHIFLLAAISSILTVAGYYMSPEGGIPWVVSTNRFLAFFAIWVMVLLLVKAKRMQEALKTAHSKLERRAAANLCETESRFRTIVNRAPAKIHIKDRDGRYLLVNSLAEKLFGVTGEDAEGKTAHEIFPREEADLFRAHDLEVLQTGRTIEQEEEWVLEGRVHTFLTAKFPIRDSAGNISGVGAIGTDITERKRAEEALRASEARISGIVDISPEAIISVDIDQRILLFNQGAEMIFGYTANEALGQTLDMLLPVDARKVHPIHFERFARSPAYRRAFEERLEIFGLRKDGNEFPAEASISKLDLGGELLFTVMLHDISERKQIEESLLAAMQQAELANRTKSEFLATMSHELRTPLNAIIGFSELITSEIFGPIGDPKYREYAADIGSSGKHLLTIINDILDISLVKSGKLDLYETAVDVPQAVDSCLTLVRARALAAGLTLETKIMDSPPPLRADECKVKQILHNLLSNAIKFSSRGGRITIRVWCHLEDGYVIQIVDSGVGIAFEDIPRVLTPFQQVDSTLARKYEGTGLGLPLSKSFVEMHGGSFDLQSEIGVGTTVTVRFPAERIISEGATARSAGSTVLSAVGALSGIASDRDDYKERTTR